MYQDFSKDVRLAAGPETVWGALLDVQRVASWLSIVRDVKERERLRSYGAVLEDRVGPFAMRADLNITVTTDEAARRLEVAASGEDRQIASRITASVDLAVSPDGTTVSKQFELPSTKGEWRTATVELVVSGAGPSVLSASFDVLTDADDIDLIDSVDVCPL